MPSTKDIKKTGDPKPQGAIEIPKKFRGKLAEGLKKVNPPKGSTLKENVIKYKPASLPARIYIDHKQEAKKTLAITDQNNAKAAARFRADLDAGKNPRGWSPEKLKTVREADEAIKAYRTEIRPALASGNKGLIRRVADKILGKVPKIQSGKLNAASPMIGAIATAPSTIEKAGKLRKAMKGKIKPTRVEGMKILLGMDEDEHKGKKVY